MTNCVQPQGLRILKWEVSNVAKKGLIELKATKLEKELDRSAKKVEKDFGSIGEKIFK